MRTIAIYLVSTVFTCLALLEFLRDSKTLVKVNNIIVQSVQNNTIIKNRVKSNASKGDTATTDSSINITNTKSSVPRNSSNAIKVPQGTWTLVSQLGGELANNLGNIAWGLAIRQWLQDEHHVRTRIVLRRQNKPKWQNGNHDIHQCFPELKQMDFEEGYQPVVIEAIETQMKRIGTTFSNMASSDEVTIRREMQRFLDAANQNESLPEEQAANNLSYPLIYGHFLCYLDLFVDRYFDIVREKFRFDPACCHTIPDPDESVFVSKSESDATLRTYMVMPGNLTPCFTWFQHFRNFLGEMPNRGKRLGFEEIGPDQMANELFGHLQPGDKVAITTRRLGNNATQPYVEALRRRGIQVRVVVGQTGVQDFCFLMNTKKELVGTATSTFAVWAGLLGNSSLVRLYSLDTPERRAIDVPLLFKYNFTHPHLRSRIKFELYKP